VLKARSAQTGGPERPGREGRAFHLLFPISFDKYNWLLKKFTPPGGILEGSDFLPGCGMNRITTLTYNSADSWERWIQAQIMIHCGYIDQQFIC